jgi:Ca-activated chloride channel family protein
MRFLSPWWLLALVPVAAVAAAYVWRQRHRRATAIRFSNVELLRVLAPAGLGWRRHLAAAAFLLSLVALSGAMARPAVDRPEPLERATVILAIDVSLSMEADDVAPNRLDAAQRAAVTFTEQLPSRYNLGLVAFARTANVLVAPVKDRVAVTAAIRGLVLAEATATGEAVFTSLEAIRTVPADGATGPPPARIVLLSDGFRTYGRSVQEAAAAAVEAQVPVSTIAFGTDDGVVEIEGQRQRVPVDRASLEELAEATGGRYYEAASADELRQVYEDMGSSVGHRVVPREITRWFLGAALVLALTAAGFSLLWTSRLP